MSVKVVKIKKEVVKVRVIGTTPLIVNAIPDWVLIDIDRKNKNLPPLERNYTHEKIYEDTIYKMGDGGLGFPSYGFKQAMVRAGKHVDGVAMTDVKPAVHVLGDLSPLYGDPVPFFTHERDKKSKALIPITYARFDTWEADLTILFVTKIFSRDNALNLLHNAGVLSGVGRRRPELGGQNGMFVIQEEDEDE